MSEIGNAKWEMRFASHRRSRLLARLELELQLKPQLKRQLKLQPMATFYSAAPASSAPPGAPSG